jgi:hypothetical protein
LSQQESQVFDFLGEKGVLLHRFFAIGKPYSPSGEMLWRHSPQSYPQKLWKMAKSA